jgi:hypothetical protein
MTIYSRHNTDRAAVYDVQGAELLKAVMAIDTDTGEVVCAHQPYRPNHLNEVDSFTIRFRSIHPIFAGGLCPCLFHCYGRQPVMRRQTYA